MKYLALFFVFSLCSGLAVGQQQEFVQPRSERGWDTGYWTAVGAAVGATTADAVTTLEMIKPHARCDIEVENPELYGKHPNAFRTLAVMGATTAGAALLSYKLRKETNSFRRRLWMVPLAMVVGTHAGGAIHNFAVCR